MKRTGIIHAMNSAPTSGPVKSGVWSGVLSSFRMTVGKRYAFISENHAAQTMVVVDDTGDGVEHPAGAFCKLQTSVNGEAVEGGGMVKAFAIQRLFTTNGDIVLFRNRPAPFASEAAAEACIFERGTDMAGSLELLSVVPVFVHAAQREFIIDGK